MTGPDVFALPHLSEDAVAAFADGVLSAAATARARRHCAECAECAGAVRVQREAAMFLRCAQAPVMPAGLLDRLSGLPMSAPLPPPRSGLPTVLGADGVPMFVSHNSGAQAVAAQPDGTLPTTDAGPADPPVRPAERRAAGSGHHRASLPLTMLASAAAVVAAGALGGQVSALNTAADLPASSSAVRLSPDSAAGAFTTAPLGSGTAIGSAAGTQSAVQRSGAQQSGAQQWSAQQPGAQQSDNQQPGAQQSDNQQLADQQSATPIRSAVIRVPSGQLPAGRRGAARHRSSAALSVPGAGYRFPLFSLRTVPIQDRGPSGGRLTPAP
jgi:hypothetical protein